MNEEKFAVVTGTVNLTNGAGTASFNYPNSFTKDNCVVLTIGVDYTIANTYDYAAGNGGQLFRARLTTNNISFSVDASTGPTGTKNVKIVLMKIN